MMTKYILYMKTVKEFFFNAIILRLTYIFHTIVWNMLNAVILLISNKRTDLII